MNKNKFDYVSIDTNSLDAWSNKYSEEKREDWKREVQGRTISVKSLNLAFQKVNIRQYDNEMIIVHSFYPEKGLAYAGPGGHPTLIIKWEVKSDLESKLDDILAELKELKSLVKTKIEG